MLRLLKIAGVILIVSCTLLCVRSVRESVLPPFAAWLDLGEHPGCARYAMVLPGDEIRRPLTVAGLIRSGLARDVLIPQNAKTADIKDGIIPPTAEISRKILLHRGIPADRIVLLPTESRTTFDDAQALGEFLRGKDDRVTIVTSAFHTRRARFVFDKVLGPTSDRIWILSAPNPGFVTERWWESREGLRLVLTEYLKLGFYYVRYSSLPQQLACAFVLAALLWWRLTTSRRRSPERVENAA